MRVICTNIGPKELGGQVEWEGSAAEYSKEIDARIKRAFDPKSGDEINRESVGHIFVIETTDQDRRDLAYQHIIKYYPEWRQLNVMRNGTQEENSKMSAFIDLCRAWSNDPSNIDPFGLDNIKP